jgi:hypothetical protein
MNTSLIGRRVLYQAEQQEIVAVAYDSESSNFVLLVKDDLGRLNQINAWAHILEPLEPNKSLCTN